MMPLNILITPIFMKVPMSMVVDLIPSLLLPFNFAKALMNAAIAMLLYKPVSVSLKKARILKGGPDSFAFDKKTLAALIGGLVLIAICVAIFLIVLHGTI
jgi:hypothetical protein